MFRKNLLLSCFLLTSSAAVAMDNEEDRAVASAKPKATCSLNLLLEEKSESCLKNFLINQQGDESIPPQTTYASLKTAETEREACAPEPGINPIKIYLNSIFKIYMSESATESQMNLLNQSREEEDSLRSYQGPGNHS